MTKHGWCVTAILLASCGGHSAPVQPAQSATAAVQSFMQAVADSNLSKMAGLWGTTSGPAARTHQPPDYERRLAIMQAYLRSDSYRVTSDTPQGQNRRGLTVELRRQACTWNVPFVAVTTSNGSWLVTSVDLAAAGNPARPCVEGDSLPKR